MPTELEEAHVGDGPRQTAILHHAAHVQVFDGDGMESACQITRELMQRIQSNGGDPRMQLRQLDLGFLAVGRALLLATETAREPSQSRQQGFVGFGSHDDLPRGQGRQSGDPQIHPHRALVFSGAEVGVRGSIHGDGNKPAVGHPGDGGRDALAGKPQRLSHPYPLQFGDMDAGTVNPELVVGEREAVVAALGLEAGVAATAGKEVVKRLSQVLDGHLRRAFRYLQHPGIVFALQRVERLAQLRFRGRSHIGIQLVQLVNVVPQPQRPIVREACHPSGLRQMGRLRVGRVQLDTMGQHHVSRLGLANSMPCRRHGEE